MSGAPSPFPSVQRPSGSTERDVVFLFDVDNTLLDNDAATQAYRSHLVAGLGARAAEHYWAIFEALRATLGYADYLGALQRYRVEHEYDPHVLLMSSYLLDYPFADHLYPGALDVLARCAQHGLTVILTDGDVVFQPRKIERAGLRRAVGDRVLVCVHKEQEIQLVERLYPATRYVLIDDKLRILAAIKQRWGARVTTVFVRQGHYANDAATVAALPPADVTIDTIADLLGVDLSALAGAGTASAVRMNP